MAKTVEIDEDVFIDMLWDRVNELKKARSFGEDFWDEVFDYLSDSGWMSNSKYNNPMYIVDNISINGEICHKDDCADNYDAINDKYDGDVEAWAEDNEYPIFGDFVVINLGL